MGPWQSPLFKGTNNDLWWGGVGFELTPGQRSYDYKYLVAGRLLCSQWMVLWIPIQCWSLKHNRGLPLKRSIWKIPYNIAIAFTMVRIQTFVQVWLKSTLPFTRNTCIYVSQNVCSFLSFSMVITCTWVMILYSTVNNVL